MMVKQMMIIPQTIDHITERQSEVLQEVEVDNHHQRQPLQDQDLSEYLISLTMLCGMIR